MPTELINSYVREMNEKASANMGKNANFRILHRSAKER